MREWAGLNSVEKIHGNLLISKNPGMRSVGGFTNLKQIDRSLSILDHSELEILGGFQALMIVGEVLTISRNSKLVTVSAFDAIEYFLDGQILIEDNPELVSIEGFNLVSEVHNDIIIRRNDALILLDSFHALTRIGASLTVAFNAKLADCKLPPALSTVSGSIYVQENAATSTSFVVKGPLALHNVGGAIEITGNQALTEVSGFEFDGSSSKVQKIVISRNTFVAAGGSFDITGFKSVGSVPDGIFIEDNDRIRLVSGFQFSGAEALVGSITFKDNSATPFALNVSGFSGLRTSGDVVIDASSLASVSGFTFVPEAGSEVGSISITSNSPPGELDISGFSGLTSAGDVVIDASSLASVSGFTFVPEAGSTMGNVSITGNVPGLGALTLSGFNGLATAGNIKVTNNHLASISGFNFVTSAVPSTGNINITANTVNSGATVSTPLSLNGFTNMVMKPGSDISIISNNGLAEGFTVQGFTFSAEAESVIGSVEVQLNAGLESISGFTSLHSSTTVGSLNIVDNQWVGNAAAIAATGFSGFMTKTTNVNENAGLLQLHGMNHGGEATAGLISIARNNALEDISGFLGTFQCTEKVAVLNNPYLKTISGFTSLAKAPLVQVLTNDRLENICGLALISFASLEYEVNGNALDSGTAIAIPFGHVGLALRSTETTPFELRCNNAPACEQPEPSTVAQASTPKITTLASATSAAPATSSPTGGANSSSDASQQDNCDCEAGSLNGAVIALIVVVVLLSIAIAAILLYFWQKKRTHEEKVRADLFLQATEAPKSREDATKTPAGGIAVNGDFF